MGRAGRDHALWPLCRSILAESLKVIKLFFFPLPFLKATGEEKKGKRGERERGHVIASHYTGYFPSPPLRYIPQQVEAVAARDAAARLFVHIHNYVHTYNA
jgi:hypothetical protein